MAGVITGLLEQLNRLAEAEGVIELAASNHPDVIDPALVRSGRFDLKIEVPVPDREGLKAILAGHLPEGGCDVGLDVLERLADQLLGASGADVAAVARTALGLARDAGRAVNAAHLTGAASSIAPPLAPEDLWRLAVHEAGHLVVRTLEGALAPTAARIGPAGGQVTAPLPRLWTPETLRRELRILLAGRVHR